MIFGRPPITRARCRSFRQQEAAQGRRLKFLKKIMKRHGRPQVIVTDGLCAYSAAMKDIGNLKRLEVGRRGSNRAENSQQRY